MMNSRKATQEYRLAQWLPIVQECRESGMTVRSWCQQNNVDEKRFYYWQNKLRVLASESIAVSNEQQSKFVPVTLPNSNPTYTNDFKPAMVLRIGQAAIELSNQVEPELLASVLKVLSNAQ